MAGCVRPRDPKKKPPRGTNTHPHGRKARTTRRCAARKRMRERRPRLYRRRVRGMGRGGGAGEGGRGGGGAEGVGGRRQSNTNQKNKDTKHVPPRAPVSCRYPPGHPQVRSPYHDHAVRVFGHPFEDEVKGCLPLALPSEGPPQGAPAPGYIPDPTVEPRRCSSVAQGRAPVRAVDGCRVKGKGGGAL